MSKRLVIIPTESVITKHYWWYATLRRFDWTWEDLLCDVVTPLLDEITRGGITILWDGDPTDAAYTGEIAYDILRDMVLGDGADVERNEFPPEHFKNEFGPMYAEMNVIVRDLLGEVAKYVRKALSKEPASGEFPHAILYERMIGRDLVLAVHYTATHS